VAPGVIPFNDLDERAEAMVRATPSGRPGTADEIADAVVFFLTTNSFITGEVIAVDGGLRLR
jgi:NAD(P)-dependent dehydrogenase (short-subunit alcohol dehydrogenase family)